MRLSRFWLWFTCLALSLAAASANEQPASRLHLIGDSTMSDKPVWPPQPERGWGQLLPLYLQDPERVVNHAMNGRSTKSFIDEGRWEKVRAALRPGDWLIIQFGHNDEKKEKPAVYADAKTDYRENLRRFISEARAAGAQPILATSIARRRFDEHGTLVETHGEYPDAMRAVANEENVPLLELNRRSSDLLRTYGPERSKELFLWIPENEYRPQAPGAKPRTWSDDTHLSAVGASRIAELAVAEILRLDLALKSWVKLPGQKPAPAPKP